MTSHGPGTLPEIPSNSAALGEEDEPPTFSPRSLAVQRGILAEAVGALGSQDFAAALSAQGDSVSDDSDWEYELENFDQINIKHLIRAELKDTVRKMIAKQKSPARTLMRDKLIFVVCTVDLYLSAYWLGCYPQSFYQLYTVKAAVLFCIRWVVYRYKRWHYFLFDLCYAAQVVLLIQLWLFPTSIAWIKVTFALNLGPLVWSIVAFRNSLVPHSLDKMTSHFLHWFPACVSYAARWHPPSQVVDYLASSAEARRAWESTSLRELFFLPLVPYLIWAVLYYLKVFVISSSRIEQRGYETLFKFATSNRRSLFGAVVLRFPHALQPAVYMAMHVGLCAATLVLTSVWWRYQLACEAFLVIQFTASAWSGATFYFDVFSRKYIAGLGASSKGSGGDLKTGAARQHDADGHPAQPPM
ncbi:hypothetical protein ACKKBF_B30760 [Auxenochlorella protothecoides x Auxenochlorella symbiontica]